MRFFDELRAEHVVIESVLGALRTWAKGLAEGAGTASDGARFLRFFRVYAGELHHDREEAILFPALEKSGLPARGPVTTLVHDHHTMAETLNRLETALGAGDREGVAEHARDYSHALWAHIDAETSVLFPESESRLEKKGIRDLPLRDLTDSEREALEDAARLATTYPPMEPDTVRGDGCVFCHAYGDTCRGIEGEWWNEWEWEELDDHIASS
jgi:hemerythrin-like domain-containing protein